MAETIEVDVNDLANLFNKKGQRGAIPDVPEKPPVDPELLRRHRLYGESLGGKFLKKKMTVPQEEDRTMAPPIAPGSDGGRGIPFATSVPIAQQIAERDHGHKSRLAIGDGYKVEAPGWHVGYKNSTKVNGGALPLLLPSLPLLTDCSGDCVPSPLLPCCPAAPRFTPPSQKLFFASAMPEH